MWSGASARPAVPALRGTPQVAAESSARPLGATPLAMLGLGVCGAMVRKQRKGGRTWEEVDRMAKEHARRCTKLDICMQQHSRNGSVVEISRVQDVA